MSKYIRMAYPFTSIFYSNYSLDDITIPDIEYVGNFNKIANDAFNDVIEITNGKLHQSWLNYKNIRDNVFIDINNDNPFVLYETECSMNLLLGTDIINYVRFMEQLETENAFVSDIIGKDGKNTIIKNYTITDKYRKLLKFIYNYRFFTLTIS